MKHSKATLLIYLVLLLLYSNRPALAQQSEFTQYYLNIPATNAGFTGVEDYLDLKSGFRQGWNDFNIKNNNVYLSAYGILSKKNKSGTTNNTLRTSDPSAYKAIQSSRVLRRKHGLGGMLTNRNFGPYRSVSINANYAYHLPISDRFNLSFGSKLTYDNQRINFNNYTVRDEVNDAFYQQLMRTNQGSQNSFFMDFGSVIYSNRFFIGISTNSIIAKKISGDNLLQESNVVRYNLQTGGNVAMGTNFTLNPGLQVSYSKEYDLLWTVNARLKYKDVIYLGPAFNSEKKLSILFGLMINSRLSINYSYDQYLSELKDFNATMHEVVVGAVLFKKYGVQSKFW